MGFVLGLYSVLLSILQLSSPGRPMVFGMGCWVRFKVIIFRKPSRGTANSELETASNNAAKTN